MTRAYKTHYRAAACQCVYMREYLCAPAIIIIVVIALQTMSRDYEFIVMCAPNTYYTHSLQLLFIKIECILNLGGCVHVVEIFIIIICENVKF